MYRILAAFLILASVLFSTPSFAKVPVANFSELRAIDTGTVKQIIDPYTLLLEDKRIVRLSGIEYPDFNSYVPGPFSVTAMKVLKDMLEGKKVNVYQTKKDDWGRSNRLGQQLAHLELMKGGAWVQGMMLELGLARVMTEERTPEMAMQMYIVEKEAIAQKAGIWGVSKYKIIPQEEAKDHIGSTQVVEGKIYSTATRQNFIYLNFGPDFRNDFTVTIKPEHRRKFFDRKLDPLKWNGKTVRVRGWVGDYNGPYIELDHPERIEIIELNVPKQEPMLKSTSKN